MREQIDMLTFMHNGYRPFGDTDARAIVICSEEPVVFLFISKIANVVRLDSLDDPRPHVNVATQTVGDYRRMNFLDRLASRGSPRIVKPGEAEPN